MYENELISFYVNNSIPYETYFDTESIKLFKKNNKKMINEKQFQKNNVKKTRYHFQMTEKNWELMRNVNLKPAVEEFREQFSFFKKI